jgi:hypothetical protein
MASSKTTAPKKVTTSFTNTAGQKVTKYSDSTKTYSGGTTDNNKTNSMVNSGKLPESQRENAPQKTSPTPQDLRSQLQTAQNALNAKTGKNVSLGNVPTITSDTLKTTPTTTLKQPAPALQTTGLNAEIGYNAQTAQDEYNQNLQNQQATALAGKTQAGTAYKDFLSNLQGTTGLTDEAYSEEGGVDDVQKELNDINQQILAEQHALTRKLEQLEKNEQGMFAGALQDQLQDVERESLRKQADLSIIQMGVQGRYDSAKAIADRAVSAYLEKQSILNETLKFNYEESKDLWSKAEQRAFESAQADRERKLTQEREDMLAIKNLAIDAQKAGASSSVVQSMLGSKTLEEAMGKTGGIFAPKGTGSSWELKDVNGVSMWVNKDTQETKPVDGGVDGLGLKPVKDLEIRDLNDTETAKNSVVSIIDNMTKSIADNGTKIFWGEEAGKRGANKTNLLLAMKNLEKTGALDKGTIDVLADLIPENEFWATEDRQIASLNQLKDTLTSKVSEFTNSYRGTTAETDPRTSRIYKTGTQFDSSLFDSSDVEDLFKMGVTTSTALFNPSSFY